jgi:hypothetical protein
MDAFLSSGGVNFTRESIRQQMQANLAHPDSTDNQKFLLIAMLNVGIITSKVWASYGLSSLPSTDDVEVVLTQLANIRITQEFIVTTLNSLLSSGDIQGIKNAVAAWSE